MEVDCTLPDEDRVVAKEGLRWVAGGRDGTLGHHVASTDSLETARLVLHALRALTSRATNENASALYALLTKELALSYIDSLLTQVSADKHLDDSRLHAVAVWLATKAADREPVKIGVGLLGLFRTREDRLRLLSIGRHEEFTLFAAVALANSEVNPEQTLWQLAQQVTGWGRIQIVARLAKTQDEQIRTWLLREGYRNDIMYEYTALICATAGGLVKSLRDPAPDDALLEGAGDILAALIDGRGGPASEIGEYPDGAEAAELYLTRLQDGPGSLRMFLAVNTIRRFMNEDEGEAVDPALGWPARKERVLALADAFLNRPDWEEQIRADLSSRDSRAFPTAVEAGRVLGIDVWPYHFERLTGGNTSEWYWVMRTDDPERIDRVIALAEERLTLEETASGYADEPDSGLSFMSRQALGIVLQDLRRFPHQGWSLILAGLSSPVTRNRNMAVAALSAWNRERWPAATRSLIARALELEPNEDTREAMRELLMGEQSE